MNSKSRTENYNNFIKKTSHFKRCFSTEGLLDGKSPRDKNKTIKTISIDEFLIKLNSLPSSSTHFSSHL